MAADHSELLAEMTTVARLSATERLKHAQKRRTQQLKAWAQMEKESARGSRAKANKKKTRATKVKFPDAVTLLEATARNDLDEGGWKRPLPLTQQTTLKSSGLFLVRDICLGE